jgi:hypothetical protein
MGPGRDPGMEATYGLRPEPRLVPTRPSTGRAQIVWTCPPVGGGYTVLPMLIVVAAVVALVWSGVRFVVDYLRRHRVRPHRYEELHPYHPPSLGEEAEEWLSRQ